MFHYNTTTEPTLEPTAQPSLLNGLIIGVGAFGSLMTIFFIMLESFLIKHKMECAAAEAEAAEAEAAEAEDENPYKEMYKAEFAKLPLNVLSEIDLLHLQTKFTRETTPTGDIILTYHKQTEAFWYYANNLKDVYYDMLEAVSRKFAIEHNCKQICLTKEPNTSEADTSEAANTSKAANTSEAANASEAAALSSLSLKKPIFAKFKKYNTGGKGANANYSVGSPVTEQAHHFRYKGKLYDYEELIKEREIKLNDEARVMMDYATFKLMHKIKTS